MYGPRYEPPPIEKIRKAQWTVENTRQTQAVVDRLDEGARALATAYGPGPTVELLRAAIDRFCELDRGVKKPESR